MISDSLIILLLPFVAFAIQIFIGKRLPGQGAWLPTGAMFIALLFSFRIFFHSVAQYQADYILAQKTWTWIEFGSVHVSFGILIDNLTAIMLVVVTLVSFLIHLYS